MRLLDLQLLRFGPFTDLILDFESGGKSLHVIFGSNEAGKSTALRAVMGLLFGIPETTGDAYVHKMSDLRIGARLENRGGSGLHVVRRKGRKNTLLDPGGGPIDDGELAAFLGGVGRELFETMFGLSHEALVQGGQDLLEGRGELGESLFGAGIGSHGIHKLLTSLKREAEEIFTPGAQKRPLNLALKAFQEAKKKSIQLSLKPREYEELQEKLQEAVEQLDGLEREHREAVAEVNRLTRLQRALPRIRKRQEFLDRKKELGEVRLVPEACTEERTKAQHTLSNAALQENKVLDEKERCEQERAALNVPEKLLAREDALEDLRDRLGAYRKAMDDLPALEAGVASAREEACSILQELGYAESPDEADRLRMDVASQARIRRLGQDRARLETEVSKAKKSIDSIENKLRDLERDRDGLPPTMDASALGRVVAEARRRGDLEEQVRNLETEIAGLEERAKNQLSALLLWRGPLDRAADLPLPPAETVERFRTAFEELAGDRRLAETQREEVRKQLEKTYVGIATLEGRGAVPSEEELRGARVERDETWREIRAVWLEGASVREKTPEALATEYDHKVQSADDVADRLWHDADRAATHSTLTVERNRCEAACVDLDQKLKELTEKAEGLEKEWRSVWNPAGIDPLPPTEMGSWLGRHEKLVDSIAQWRERERARDALLREIREHRDRCSGELVALGEPPPDDNESLAALLERAEGVVDFVQEIDAMRRQALRDVKKAASERQEFQAELSGSEKALESWRQEWRQAVQPLGLDATAATEEAEAVLNGLSRLFQKVGDVRRNQIRIDHIKKDARRFAGEVEKLMQECAPDLQSLPPDEAAAELVNQFKKGKDDLKDQNNLDKRLKQIRRELADQKRDWEGAKATLDRLMESAGARTPEELEKAERRSKEYRDITSKLEDLEEQLLGEGVPIEELLEQAQTVDPDVLPAEISRHEEKSGDIGKDCAELRERIGSLRNELGAMDGSGAAAEAAAEAQEALAATHGHVESYARLKLAALLLSREIERYRERNQGPILKRAAELLRQITLGSFSDLSTGFAESDNMILLCVRGNGEHVPVEGLSDGTRDQLYLALRLASLERHVDRNEPTPLVFDDVLVNFDDRRAHATLGLLGELSEKTQVLFFTHHSRLVELAREAIPPQRVKEHDLDQLASCS